MTYMILDSNGNALDSFNTFSVAALLLEEIVRQNPDYKDEFVIVEYDEEGHAINACKYEDLI